MINTIKMFAFLTLGLLSFESNAADCYKHIPHTAGYSALIPGINYFKAVKCEFKSFKNGCPNPWSNVPSDFGSWYNFDTNPGTPLSGLPAPGAGCCIRIYYTPSLYVSGFTTTNCSSFENSSANRSAHGLLNEKQSRVQSQ